MKNSSRAVRLTRTGAVRLTRTAMIAALYAAATLLLQPFSFGALQLRAAEALTLLPLVFPEATAGITLGCAISNAIGVATGANICGVLDVVFGTLATLGAAAASRALRNVRWRGLPLLSALMPVVFNGVVVGLELAYFVGLPFWLCALQVAAGEAIVTLALGLPLEKALEKRFN